MKPNDKTEKKQGIICLYLKLVRCI
ncbi:unnamed protein product [Spirodela intermedia]|uniref:Uncharacterized protein n=1 Tax=Spirodela intermedia TaxID=51605 RepID=A0A7I8KF28_SPIIN|nr:unnamed protein product [Spirodela intermedia]